MIPDSLTLFPRPSMNTLYTYKMAFVLRPSRADDTRSDSYADLTREIANECEDEFGGRGVKVAVNFGPLSASNCPSVASVHLHSTRKSMLWDVHEWFGLHIRSKLPQSFTAMVAASDGDSIVRARWVPLESDWYNVELGKDYKSPANRRPCLCGRCGWQDFDAAPDPFYVDRCIATAGRNEFLPAMNGVFVVSRRILDLFVSLVDDDFRFGPVVSRGKSPTSGEFFWIRPSKRIGGHIAYVAEGDRCPGCGTAARLGIGSLESGPPVGQIVENFGDPAPNLSIVGDQPMGERARMLDEGVSRKVAISGGLFAVLWNHGVKGLKWPREGPYISRVAHEETWEPSRRFAEVFSAGGDKAAKYKPKQ